MKSIGEKITEGIQKFYAAFNNKRVLKTLEEVQANTNEKNIASAVVVGELTNNLMFPDGTRFYPDKQGDDYGFNTDAARGADTFRPFKSKPFYLYKDGVFNAVYVANNRVIPKNDHIYITTTPNSTIDFTQPIDVTHYNFLMIDITHGGNGAAVVGIVRNINDKVTYDTNNATVKNCRTIDIISRQCIALDVADFKGEYFVKIETGYSGGSSSSYIYKIFFI